VRYVILLKKDLFAKASLLIFIILVVVILFVIISFSTRPEMLSIGFTSWNLETFVGNFWPDWR
jgi:hypothetical protein